MTTDYEHLKDLTVRIWEEFYKEESPEWEPLDDILGLITQIDNMVCGLEKRKRPQRDLLDGKCKNPSCSICQEIEDDLK